MTSSFFIPYGTATTIMRWCTIVEGTIFLVVTSLRIDEIEENNKLLLGIQHKKGLSAHDQNRLITMAATLCETIIDNKLVPDQIKRLAESCLVKFDAHSSEYDRHIRTVEELKLERVDIQDLIPRDMENFSISKENYQVLADRSAITQVIRTLMQNAIEESPHEVKYVRLSKSGWLRNKIKVSVENQGNIGNRSIEEQGFTTKVRGSGYGLYGAGKICKAHGYHLKIEKRSPVVISFILPVAKPRNDND